MSDAINYVTGVRTDWDYEDMPNKASFSIDEQTARTIVQLAGVVRANNLFKVEKFDFRTCYQKEENGEVVGFGVAPDCLVVSASVFWFSATIQHTSVEIRTDAIDIAIMASHFGIEFVK